jgi:hypothetical protein
MVCVFLANSVIQPKSKAEVVERSCAQKESKWLNIKPGFEAWSLPISSDPGESLG